MTLENYALKILADHDCDCYTYGGESAKHVLSDLKIGYPDGMEYPYIDVANAILAISKPMPIVKAPYIMAFDTDSDSDGIDCETFGGAKMEALDTLVEWMVEERNNWKDAFHPTAEELDAYNYMICNSSVLVSKYNPNTDEYETEWEPSYADEEDIGWKELTMEDIQREEHDAKRRKDEYEQLLKAYNNG